ncbi:MAG: 2-oxo-hepta-3-ene-1,7-dioic acid hydratase, partial [Acidimicrobiia bacterium]
MSASVELIAQLAGELHRAERDRVQIKQLSQRHRELTIDDAYAIQMAWADIKLSEGRVLLGRKIGLTSRAMQQAVNITEPDFGGLFDDMFFADGSDV